MNDTSNSVRKAETPDCSERADLQQAFLRKQIKQAMGRAIGRGGVPVKKLSEAAGHKSDRRLYDHLRMDAPNLPNVMDFGHYMQAAEDRGAELGNAVFGLFGFSGLHRVDGAEVCAHQVAQDFATYVPLHIDYAKDGRFDHRERLELVERLRRLESAAAELRARLGTTEGVFVL